MNTNPYAPPTANVEDVSSAKVSPALWNPSAAARWSLLLSPIFGAILHMKNWQALGEPEKAAQSKYWVLGNVAFFLVILAASFVVPESKGFDVGARAASIGLLVAWYRQSAKAQTEYITARFGTGYPRRSWWPPFLYVLLIIVAFSVGIFVIAFTVSMLEGEG